MLQTVLFLQRFSHFLELKASHCSMPLANFQKSEKLVLKFLCSIVIDFMERISSGLHSDIAQLSLHSITLKCQYNLHVSFQSLYNTLPLPT